jgi:peptide-methionine (S)-S-oxide reductase
MASPEIATLGGGCFWCLETVFERLAGVERVVSGYAGGTPAHPSYDLVCTGTTGHAEVAQVTFDPDIIAYRDLLDVFFVTHDPTQLNRQGADVGTQYRSVIFTHSAEQDATARAVLASLALEQVYDRPIVTIITPLDAFYPAERYHQEYYRRNPTQSYCQVVIAPKVAKLRAAYLGRLKPEYRAP